MFKNIKLKNFQLYQDCEIDFEKLNIITGINEDNPNDSGNASGKSTILEAITYILYGEVPNVNLSNLIHSGEKKAEVEGTIELGKDIIRIIRTIPSSLTIYINDKELQANTSREKQKWINETFGDFDHFKKYRLIDGKRGINLLDMGIVSLRKTLMLFIEDEFSIIRKKLLDGKLEREKLSKDKRLYSFFLSQKRLDTLKEGLKKLQQEYKIVKEEINAQQSVVNKTDSEINSKQGIIRYKESEKNRLNGGVCPILKRKCSDLVKELENVVKEKDEEIKTINTEIKELSDKINIDKSYLKSLEDNLGYISKRGEKTQLLESKLQQAFKFSSYKYTQQDIDLYSNAIKVLDTFSGAYIEDWLSQLSLVINDLLRPINLEVEFSSDKDFIKVKDNGNIIPKLSNGQNSFLNAIFKLAILVHSGEIDDNVILIDEGVSEMDENNFIPFIDVLRNLSYQFFIIYQNIPDIKEVNKIKIRRKNNVSNVEE